MPVTRIVVTDKTEFHCNTLHKMLLVCYVLNQTEVEYACWINGRDLTHRFCEFNTKVFDRIGDDL